MQFLNMTAKFVLFATDEILWYKIGSSKKLKYYI